jgi:hypothetical protein
MRQDSLVPLTSKPVAIFRMLHSLFKIGVVTAAAASWIRALFLLQLQVQLRNLEEVLKGCG